MKLTTSAINNYGDLVKTVDLPAPSTFERVAPKRVPNDGSLWLVMEMYNLRDELFSSNPDQCNSFNNTYQFVAGKSPDGGWMLFSGLALPLQNTIENPLPDGGLQAAFEGGRTCSNVAKNFLNIESCYLSKEKACQSSATGRNEWDWQANARNNVVVCGSEGEVASDDGIVDISKPMFSLYGHNHNLISGEIVSVLYVSS